MKQTHVPLLRRRRQGLTDYRSRRRAVMSQRPLLVVRISNKNVYSQFVKPTVKGDLVLSSSSSKELAKYGWSGSSKSTPACYLLGLLAGKKGMKAGVKEAVLYNGVAPFIKGSRVSSFLKGVVDAGLSVPVGDGAFPSEERVTGKTIAEFASRLSGEDKESYQSRFSSLLKSGFDPERYAENFEKSRSAIAEAEV